MYRCIVGRIVYRRIAPDVPHGGGRGVGGRVIPPTVVIFIDLPYSVIEIMANINAYQLPLPRGTFADGKPHPSNGGNPYSDDFRNDVIQRYLLNQSLNTAELNALRAIYAYPSLSTCRRYIEKWHALGHCHPMRPTGNHEALREVRGQDMVNLALFRTDGPSFLLLLPITASSSPPPWCSHRRWR